MTLVSAAAAAYIVAALLFVLSLAGLSRHESARAGNTYGIAGMALALAATVALVLDAGISAGGHAGSR
jgi:H+-translocating NAD(P) transhydrogenase subunit beta